MHPPPQLGSPLRVANEELLFIYVFSLCMCVLTHVFHSTCMGTSLRRLLGTSFFLWVFGSWDQIQFIRLDTKHFSPTGLFLSSKQCVANQPPSLSSVRKFFSKNKVNCWGPYISLLSTHMNACIHTCACSLLSSFPPSLKSQGGQFIKRTYQS